MDLQPGGASSPDQATGLGWLLQAQSDCPDPTQQRWFLSGDVVGREPRSDDV